MSSFERTVNCTMTPGPPRYGVHVPHDLAWALEHADPPEAPRFRTVSDLGDLPGLVDEIG